MIHHEIEMAIKNLERGFYDDALEHLKKAKDLLELAEKIKPKKGKEK